MPKTAIEIENRLHHLSILDEDGRLDGELAPSLADGDLLAILRAMLLTREFDERMLRMQRQGRIGTFPPVRGQEAPQIAGVHPLGPDDWMVPSFREVGSMLLRGWKMEHILLYYAGYEEGAAPPPGVKDLPICIPVTSQLPHAVGLAWASKLRGEESATLCFLGDGATSEGDFHEAMNFASVYDAPVVFLCQNNGWAISLPTRRQTRSRTLAQKAVAYEMPGIQLDGNDPLAVHHAVDEALRRARSGGGPTFIEAVTYRLSVHTTADDPKRYRTDEEVEIWEKREPIARFKKYLIEKGVLTESRGAEILEEVREEIRTAVERAEVMMEGDPLDMFDFLYDSPSDAVLEQRRELEDLLHEAGIDKTVGVAAH